MKCPESIEELQELEKLIPLCKVTLYDQAKARIETGAAKSLHEASRQLAEETGRKPETIERAIQREQGIKGVTVSPVTSDKYKPLVLDESEKKIILRAAKEISDSKRESVRESIIAKLEDIKTKEIKKISGIYDVIVIDPPWPMEKIERDVRPNQSEFEYPTMDESELENLEIPLGKDCHVWVWTTQKFLPMSFRLINKWGLKYVCTFIWHKAGGFQPINLPQYNAEFAVYCRFGHPNFIDTKSFPVCFNALRGAHSEKPKEFYEMVCRVTAGRRLDMFSRREINGFDGWGQEAK